MKENKLKLFVAIPVPQNLKQDIRKFIESNSSVANVRWLPEENWHVTLFFIGFVNENKLDSINEKLTKEIKLKSPFTLHFEKFSMEGKPSQYSMIWFRFKFSETFSEISEEIKRALKKELEQVQEFKRSIPHITLARLRKSVKRKEINLNFTPDTKETEVSDCQLWQSIGTTSGMVYKNLFNYDFRK